MRPNLNITGVVLAGGASSRLGLDKAELVLREPGLSLLTETARLLRRVVPKVIISGREQHEEFAGLPDDVPGKGPVGAVVTALRHTGTACFVLACDLAFMNERLLRLLLEARCRRAEGALVTAFVHPDTGGTENLVAIYEQEALRYLEPCLEAGLLKIGRAVPRVRYCPVPVPAREREAFFNINSPADLAAAREKVSK